MGQIADDMINGICCDLCGCYFMGKDECLYEHGHSATCWECWGQLTEQEMEFHTKAEVTTFY